MLVQTIHARIFKVTAYERYGNSPQIPAEIEGASCYVKGDKCFWPSLVQKSTVRDRIT